MSKTLLCVILLGAFICIFWGGVTQAADPGLVGWWKLDETSGTVAADSSGNARNGTLYGNPQWVDGHLGGALKFDGDGDYVSLPIGPLIASLNSSCTFTWWVNYGRLGNGWQRMFDFGTGTAANLFVSPNGGTARVYWCTCVGAGGALVEVITGSELVTGWHHCALTINADADVFTLFLDGSAVQSTANATVTPSGMGVTTNNWLGRSQYAADPYFNGILDDFRIYNRLLSPEEILDVMKGKSAEPFALNPYPENEDVDVPTDVILNWKPGIYADTHNVFIGSDFNDVNNATVASHPGVTFTEGLDVNNLNPGTLEYGMTYYWRVDEVNAPSKPYTYKGTTWSFTIEPRYYKLSKESITVAVRNSSAKNDPNNTINEVGLDPNYMDQHSNSTGMWLSGTVSAADPAWVRYDFDKLYKLHEMFVWNYNSKMLLNSGFRQVLIEYSADGSSWTPVPSVTEFAKASGNMGYVYNTVVPFNDIAAKSVRITALSNWGTSYKNGGLSEIRFTYIPTRARIPSPDTGSANVPVDVKLSWRPGRDAVTHDVYFSTNEQAVINGTAPVSTVNLPGIGPMSLELNRVYYWRVDEVNNAETPSRWASDIWNFYSMEYASIDDFEDYNGNDGYYIWQTWDDGASKPANGGSQIGHLNNPFIEPLKVQHGKQSAPLYYDNTSAGISEISAQSLALPIGTTNWTKGNPDTLVIWFLGDANNPVTDRLYMKLNTTKKVYDGDAADIMRSTWTRWEIPLAGINLNNISSIAIGVEKTGAAGGKGILYLDNIQLTISVKAADPGLVNLIAKYDMENNVQDSSGNGLNGTAIGAVNGPPTYQAGKHGQALVLDGNDDYVALPIGQTIGTMTDCSISAWVKWSGGSSWQRVFDFGRGITDNMYLTPRLSSTQMRFAIKVGNGTESQATASPILSTGNWEHLAVVIDGTQKTATLYRNGEIVATNTSLSYLPKNMGVTTQNWLGRSQYASDPYFKGMLDDFRIYNRSLSESEVKYLYKN